MAAAELHLGRHHSTRVICGGVSRLLDIDIPALFEEEFLDLVHPSIMIDETASR
jgi:hypothetical protein